MTKTRAESRMRIWRRVRTPEVNAGWWRNRWAIGLAFALACDLAAGAGCVPDNSVGKDAVPGTGATGAATAAGSGGAGAGPASGSGGAGAGDTGPIGNASTGGVTGTGAVSTGTGGGSIGPTDGGAGGRGTMAGGGAAGAPAASGDAGAVTAGGPVVAGGDSKCSPTVGTLCDGFETAALGAAGSAWTAAGAGATTVVVDGTKPFRGTKSVHITFSGTDQGFITETQTFSPTAPATANDAMWGRMFVWYQLGAGQTPPAGHFVFIRAEGTVAASAPAASAQLHVAGGHGAMLGAQIRTTTDLYKYAVPAVPVPQATPTWQCWEWHTAGDNTLQFYINGKAVPGMAATAADKWPFPNFNKLYLGWLDFSAGPSGQMWIDEVAVGATQIGCDN